MRVRSGSWIFFYAIPHHTHVLWLNTPTKFREKPRGYLVIKCDTIYIEDNLDSWFLLDKPHLCLLMSRGHEEF